MTSYKHAALQMYRTNLRQQASASVRNRTLRPIRIIDALIGHLEELHLQGRKRVPADFDTVLAQLNEALPGDLRQELKSRITIGHLMDRLYEIQDELFARTGSRPYDVEDDGDQGGPQRLNRAS